MRAFSIKIVDQETYDAYSNCAESSSVAILARTVVAQVSQPPSALAHVEASLSGVEGRASTFSTWVVPHVQ